MVVIVLGLTFSLILFSGSTKKEIVKEEPATKEQAVAAKEAGGTAKTSPAVKEDTTTVASEEATAM